MKFSQPPFSSIRKVQRDVIVVHHLGGYFPQPIGVERAINGETFWVFLFNDTGVISRTYYNKTIAKISLYFIHNLASLTLNLGVIALALISLLQNQS